MLYVVMGDECSTDITGVMIPTPQYPLYTAALAELGAHPVSIILQYVILVHVDMYKNNVHVGVLSLDAKVWMHKH